MTPFSRILRDYRDSGALHTLVSIQSAIDRYTFLTKSGALVTVLKVQGRDPECLEDAHLDHLARRFETALRTFDEKFRFYQYVVKRELGRLPQDGYAGPLGDLLESRRRYLEAKHPLYEIGCYFAVVYERSGPSATGGKARRALFHGLSNAAHSLSMQRQLERDSEILAQKITAFIAQVEEVVHLRALPTQEAFGFLFGLLNYEAYKVASASFLDSRFVDFQLCQSALECHRDHLRLDDDFVHVLTLNDLPSKTSAYQLRNLHRLPCQCLLVSEWRSESPGSMRRQISSRRRHFNNVKTSLLSHLNTSETNSDRLVDDSAVALLKELGASLEACEARGHTFGQFSLTVILHDKDRAQVKKAVAELTKQATVLEAQFIEERYNLLNAWLAALPGNAAFNLRRHWLLDTNYADWLLCGTPDQGSRTNGHLGREYLAALETNDATPYYFNLHNHDVAHTAVFGETGSGKSFLLNFLITHVLKYDPYLYVFDLGGSYQTVTSFFGGKYVRLGPGQEFAINPFALPCTPGNLQFLFLLVKVLVESDHYRLTAPEEADLYEQIKNLYAVEPSQRRLLTLSNIVGREIRQRLKPWTQGGQYGWLFDNTEDHLSLARFQVFDFEGMESYPALLEPLLFYVLHRASQIVTDDTLATVFKAFLVDEAWRFFRHPSIKLYITEALKTWRRRNAAMVLATQSTDDIASSAMLPVVSESCPTKLYLANRGMDPRVARDIFRLNETEAALMARLTPKREMLIHRPGGSKVVNLTVDPTSYWLYTTSPHEAHERRQVVAEHGLREGLTILAGSQSS